MKGLLTLAFATLWIADTAFTTEFVQEQGLQMEANPIMAWVIAMYGISTFTVVKLVILAVWVMLQKKAHIALHVGLVVIMLPVVYAGFIVASSI